MTERQALAKARKLARENKCDYVIYEDLDDYTDRYVWYIIRASRYDDYPNTFVTKAWEVNADGYIF
jgi:hypothetical protein